MTEKEKIEKVCHVFDCYIKQHKNLDLVKSKYGYLVLFANENTRAISDASIYTTAEEICSVILDCMTQDFLYEKNLEGLLIPKEYISEFFDCIRKYLSQLPEYTYLIERCIEVENR